VKANTRPARQQNARCAWALCWRATYDNSSATNLKGSARCPDPQGRPGGAEVFREEYGAKYPKAVAKLDRDGAQLTAFYDFTAEHGGT
jgi:hypothetical protein